MESEDSARQLQASHADLVNEVINQVQALQDRYSGNPAALAAQLKILAGTGKYDGVVASNRRRRGNQPAGLHRTHRTGPRNDNPTQR